LRVNVGHVLHACDADLRSLELRRPGSRDLCAPGLLRFRRHALRILGGSPERQAGDEDSGSEN
jgi:hypothetical protein